jgi:hypothetical protein
MQSHTRIIELLVSLCFRRSQKRVLQSDANVANGTLEFFGFGVCPYRKTGCRGSGTGFFRDTP